MKCSVQALAPNQPITVDQTAILTYTVTNITNDFRDSTRQGPEKLHYTLSSDPSNWELNMQSGEIQAPRIAQSVSFKIAATPKQIGLMVVPSCVLVLETPSSEDGGTVTGDNSTDGAGIERATSVTREGLSGARCYNTCEWHQVDVQ